MEAWIGLLGSIVVAACSLVGVLTSNKNTANVLLEQVKAQSELADERMRTVQAVTDTKLDRLTEEVRKHNNFAEKIPVLEEKIKVASKRIDSLERNAG